jgi:hypothetical protein
MQKRHHFHLREREHNPRLSLGLFFITLGLALLVVTNDLLHLGSPHEYFTWQSILIFIGIVFLINLRLAPALLFIAGGVWFLLDNIYVVVPRTIEVAYWPSVIILMGIIFISSALLRRKNNNIQ